MIKLPAMKRGNSRFKHRIRYRNQNYLNDGKSKDKENRSKTLENAQSSLSKKDIAKIAQYSSKKISFNNQPLADKTGRRNRLAMMNHLEMSNSVDFNHKRLRIKGAAQNHLRTRSHNESLNQDDEKNNSFFEFIDQNYEQEYKDAHNKVVMDTKMEFKVNQNEPVLNLRSCFLKYIDHKHGLESITFPEFCNLKFKHDYPNIMYDVIYCLGGSLDHLFRDKHPEGNHYVDHKKLK